MWSRAGIAICFVALASAYSCTVPAWEAPDEFAHFRYVKHLVEERRLPVQKRDVFGEEHQAPLYYVIAALPSSLVDLTDTTGRFRWNRNFGWEAGRDVNMALATGDERVVLRGHGLALRIMRGVSILLATGTILLAASLAHVAGARDRFVVLVAMAMVAFNPQFLFISGAANNDNLLTFCWTAALLQMIRVVQRQDKARITDWVWVGAWLAAALLAKASGISLVPVIGLAIGLRAFRDRDVRTAVRAAVAVGGTVFVLTGWWFVRNIVLYGDPAGLATFRETSRLVSELGWRDLPLVLLTQLRSFWALFGWMNVSAPSWFYGSVTIATAAAIVVVAAYLCSTAFAESAASRKDTIVLLLGAIVSQESFQLTGIHLFGESWLQGRYLFPVLPASAVLVSVALEGVLPAHRLKYAAYGVAAGLAVCSIYLLLEVVVPTYSLGSAG